MFLFPLRSSVCESKSFSLHWVKDISKRLSVVFGEIRKNSLYNKQLSHASTYKKEDSKKILPDLSYDRER